MRGFTRPRLHEDLRPRSHPLAEGRVGPAEGGALHGPEAYVRDALAGRYALQRELGRGGMATVYLADDLRHRRSVAIKVLRPELAATLGPDRFLREIEVTAQLHHPMILPLLDSGEASGTLYYVMPFVEGESLRERLNREQQLPLDEALRITKDVAEALGYAHSRGVVHRDIKPENILLESGHALVADFGIATALAAAGGARLTETGMMVGTPAYMSPEQGAGAKNVDGRSDIYSLGCVLYEMLAGEPPFRGPSAQAILARQSLDPVPRLRTVRDSVPEALEAAVLRALAKVPADRFATVQQFSQALAWDTTVYPKAQPRKRLWKLVRTMGAAFVLLAAALVSLPATRGRFFGAARPAGLSSVAVLPFVNQTGDTGNEYLTDGITDELIGRLARLPGMERVISRASVFTYKGRTVDPRTVAADLDVAVVVTGSVVQRDSNWVLSVEVTDARDDRRLWGDTYSLTPDELLSVTDRLAREIPRAIDVEPREGALAPSPRRASRNPQAHRLYLQGLYLLNQASDNSLPLAVEYYERALDVDPGYALPYAGIARAYGLMALFGLDEPSAFYPKARRAARRALTLDDQVAEAHMGMAFIHHVFEWDWTAAEDEHRQALRLAPQNTEVLAEYSWFLVCMNRFDEAIAMIERARDLDPVSEVRSHAVAWTYHVAGQEERAVEEWNRLLELFPNSGLANLGLAWALSRIGRDSEAVAAANRAESGPGGEPTPWMLASLGWVYARSGRTDRAREHLDALNAMTRERYVDPQFIAVLHSGLGETEDALQWLERAYAARSPNLTSKSDGRVWFPELLSDPRYQALRSTSHFPPD